MQKWSLIIMVLFLCTACTMPETKIYSLSLPVAGKRSDEKSVSSVNMKVHSSRYLSQQYIAHRTSPYQLVVSKYSRWEASPDEMLRDAFRDRFFAQGIFKEVKTSNFIPAGYYSAEIKLRRFERTDSGNDSFGEMDFDIALSSPDGKEIYRNTISRKIRLEHRDNPSLAKALSAALSEGVDEAVTGIAGVMDHP